MENINDVDEVKEEITPLYSRKKCFLAQFFVAIVLGFVNSNIGLIISIPVLVIGGLLDEKELFHINSYEASWFGSIPFICISIGSVLAGFVQDVVGRKGAVLFAHLPAVLGWILLYYSNSIEILYSSAVVMGLGIGFAQSPTLSYSGEVFQPKLRGTLSSIQGIFFNISFIAVFVTGAVYSWRTVAGVCTFWPILTFVLILWMPESPVWLAQNKKIKQGKASLCWLRGWTEDAYIQDEWNNIMKNCSEEKDNQDIQLTHLEYQQLPQNELGYKLNKNEEKKSYSFDSTKNFFRPEVQKPLLLITMYFFCVFCACLIPTKPVLINILREMKVSADPYWFMAISSVFQLLGAVAFSLVLKYFGKRLITFFGFIFAVITCYGLGLYDFLNINMSWIPLTLLTANSFLSTFGLTTIPWILISEIFPLEFRGMASGVSTALCNVLTFFLIKTFIYVELLLGLSGSFVLYGTFGLFGLIYLYFKLPETEGKSLHDIESKFRAKSKN